MIQVTVKVSETELAQIIGKDNPEITDYAQALAQDVVDRFLNSEYIDPETIKEWFENAQKQEENRIPEDEIIERVSKVLSDDMSEEDFVEEINRILGTTYTANDIEWRN